MMMKKLLLKSMLLLCVLVVGVNGVWGQATVGTVLWSETWTGATTGTAAGDKYTPSANYGKGTTVYNSGTVTYTQSANSVYVRNEKTGGGTAPELLLSSGQTWTISNIPTGGATELALTYVSNNTKSSVTCSTSSASISGSSKSYTITTGGAEKITLVFGCTGNTRIDNVELKVKTAAVSKTNVGSFSAITDQTVTKGGSIDFDPSDYYTDDAGVTGTTTFTVTPTSGDIYYSGGKIYATAFGSQEFTVTATPAATDASSYKAVSTTFTATCPDNRTAVNLSTFTATNTTLVAGGSPSSTATSVTNDQAGWTAAYTYESSNTDVATVNASGVITAVAKGTATITCSLNVDADDATYKAGSTASKTIDITVNNPTHTVTFSINGNTSRTATVEEGDVIPFPTAADTPADASEFNKTINGMTFVGWYGNTYSHVSTAPTFVPTSTTMGNADITYYAVYAEKSTEEGEVTKSFGFETSSSDDWTLDLSNNQSSDYAKTGSYSGYIGKNNTYVTFKEKVYVTNFSFEFLRASTNNNYYVYIETSSDGTSWTAVETYAMSSFTTEKTWYNKSHAFDGKTALYVRFHCYNTTAARYVDDVTIKYNSTITTYSDYCTTVSALPKPVITLSTTAIDMTWGDEDKTLTASAKIGDEDFDGTITMTPSDANLAIDGSGNIRCDVPGDYTITASIAAKDGEYQAANSVVCNVTVGKQDATVSFAEATVQKLLSDATYTQTATKSPAGAGDITYSISPSGNTINSSTGAVTLTKAGDYTVTATAAANTLYNEAAGSYTLQIRQTPTITLADKAITYGETLNVAKAFTITGGAVTVTSSNTDVATADGTVITTVAAGTSTITVATAANDTYVAGEETFTLTVNSPAGGTTAKPATEKEIVSQTLLSTSFPTGWTGDGNIWSGDATYGAAAANGTIGNSYDLKTETINLNGNYTAASVSFEHVGNKTFTTSGDGRANACKLFVKDGDTETQLTINKMFAGNNWSFVTNETDLTDYIGKSIQLIFRYTPSAGNQGKWEVKNFEVNATTATTELVTLNAQGFATFCSQYPIDFSTASGFSAWQLKSADSEGTIMFEKVTGSVKGGTGLLLRGTANAEVELTSADSDTELSDNKLVGTLVPMNIAAGEYYGLSGNTFVPVSAGNVPAGKALLPASIIPSDARQLSFVFADDNDPISTGINAVSGDASVVDGAEVYDLQGRKVSQPSRGLYIVNGRKVVIK